MSDNSTGQVSRNAADVYEEFFVPALFQEWPRHATASARLKPNQRVLDVACGTGVLARAAADIVGANGSVIGLDINDAMLKVAKRKAPHIEWRQARAETLPFDSGAFDAVVSQFGLMFFEDRIAALKEMMRVLRQGGRLVVVVWNSIDTSPGFAALQKLLRRHLGERGADSLCPPFVLGDKRLLSALFKDAGIEGVEIETQTGTARFPSIDQWLHTEVRGWTLDDAVDDNQFERLLNDARESLIEFTDVNGRVAFSVSAHIATAVGKQVS